MPRILYIGGFTKLWDEEGNAKGLEANGAEVVRYDQGAFHWKTFQKLLDEEKFDYMMFAKLPILPYKRREAVNLAKNKKIKTVCYVPDLYWGLDREERITRDSMFTADIVMTPDGGSHNWPCNHVCVRQSIPDEYCYIGEKDERLAHDVVFVGSLNAQYPYRTKLVSRLQHRYGDRFKWYGMANSDEIRGHKLNTLYASAKVIIGESVYAPYYWSNRIYETLGRGGFCVHPQVEGLEKDYEPYKHFLPYKHGDYDGLFEIIDYFVAHDEERKKIAEAAQEHTKKHHTNTIRMKELLNVLRDTFNI